MFFLCASLSSLGQEPSRHGRGNELVHSYECLRTHRESSEQSTWENNGGIDWADLRAPGECPCVQRHSQKWANRRFHTEPQALGALREESLGTSKNRKSCLRSWHSCRELQIEEDGPRDKCQKKNHKNPHLGSLFSTQGS